MRTAKAEKYWSKCGNFAGKQLRGDEGPKVRCSSFPAIMIAESESPST